MPNLTTVTLTSGAPTAGTGTVSTLDNLIGTAGTGSAQVLTVQGNASGTAVPVSGTVTANAGTNLNTSALALETGGNLANAATALGATGDAAVTAGATGSISAKLRSISRDIVANIVLAAGSNSIGTVVLGAGSAIAGLFKVSDGTNTAAVKAASTAAAATDPALVVGLSPNGVTRGSGASDSSTIRVTVGTDQLAALSTTAQAMSTGFQLVSTPTDQVVPNKLQSQTNGATSSRVNSAASTNATSLKASAGAVAEIDVFNNAAYSVFLKFYNKASAPTVGTDTPTWTIPIAAGTGYSKSFRFGKWFSTGVAYAITKLQVDGDTTVVVAGDLTGSIDWI